MFALSILITKTNIKIMNQIIVNHGIKNRIKKDLNTTYPTIRAALYGITDTKKAQKIRALALKLGGVEVESKNAD